MKRTKILKELIANTGMTQKAFAREIGVPYTTLRSMLSRPMGNASIDNVIKACKALGITVEDLQVLAENGEQELRANTVAAHLEGAELSEEEGEELDNFISFLLSKRKR